MASAPINVLPNIAARPETAIRHALARSLSRLILTRVSADVATATDPDSHGGPSITDHELMERERSIRESHRLTGWMLSKIDAIRGVGLRGVA